MVGSKQKQMVLCSSQDRVEVEDSRGLFLGSVVVGVDDVGKWH